MRGMLFLGGARPGPVKFAPYRDARAFVIAADSGLETALELGIIPNLVVGDMDSLGDERLLDRCPADSVIRYPVEKDETDAEIGMRMMKKRGIDKVTMIGGGEGRLAHLLGILQFYERNYRPYLWVTAREEVSVVADRRTYEVSSGRLFSFFPLGDGVEIDSSTGLKWPLTGLSWKRGQGGISNVATGSRVSVSVSKGRLLAIKEI